MLHMDPKAALLTGFGGTVRELRRVRGWTRRELARRSGVSERFLAEIENGRGNPSLLRMFDLANCFGTTPDALLQRVPAPDSGRRIVALIGLRGAGKTSVGNRLASSLGMSFVELDALVEERAGLSLGEMFELHGQAYYRRVEQQVLKSLLAERDSIVLSTGGGLVTEPQTFALLQRHAHTVWLRASPEDHWERVVAQGDTRPMQGDGEAFSHLCSILEEREGLYQQAQVTVDTSGVSLDEVCGQLTDRFAALAS